MQLTSGIVMIVLPGNNTRKMIVPGGEIGIMKATNSGHMLYFTLNNINPLYITVQVLNTGYNKNGQPLKIFCRNYRVSIWGSHIRVTRYFIQLLSPIKLTS